MSDWTIMNAQDVLVNAAGGAVLVFLGTIVISLCRAAKLLDDQWVAETEARLQEVRDAHQKILREIENAHLETKNALIRTVREKL